jgi:hypothetical protein
MEGLYWVLGLQQHAQVMACCFMSQLTSPVAGHRWPKALRAKIGLEPEAATGSSGQLRGAGSEICHWKLEEAFSWLPVYQVRRQKTEMLPSEDRVRGELHKAS